LRTHVGCQIEKVAQLGEVFKKVVVEDV